MNKLVVLCLAVMLGCSCGASQAPDAAPPDPVIDDPRAMIIRTTCEDGSVWLGTGFEIASDTVATAAHVLMCDDKEPVKIEFVFPGSVPVNVTGLPRQVETEFDVAGINFYSEAPTLEYRQAKPGEHVCFYPAYPVRGMKCGYVIDIEAGAGGMTAYLDVVGGNSGSVLLSDKNEVLGVVIGTDHIFGYVTPVID